VPAKDENLEQERNMRTWGKKKSKPLSNQGKTNKEHTHTGRTVRTNENLQ